MSTASNTVPANEPVANVRFKDKRAFFNSAAKLGVAEATGKLKRPEFAVEVVIAATERLITTDDAAEAWRSFRTKGRNLIRDVIRDNEKSDESSEEIRISETRQLIRVGMNHNIDGLDLITRARDVILRAETVKGTHWDNLIKICRLQLKSEHMAKTLTDDEIAAAIAPKEAKEKQELDLLKAQVKQLEKIRSGTENTATSVGKPAFPSEQLDKAIDVLNDRIAQLEFKAKFPSVLIPANRKK